jgi:hypothetical protein
MDTAAPHFHALIQNVRYRAHLVQPLRNAYEGQIFDVNAAAGYGRIVFPSHEMAYSKWVSPKRTRSYPYARIYNTYNHAKPVTVIPVLKDEGADGDFDRLQISTIYLMSLLNVYVVLGYYENASRNPRYANKLTSQRFNSAAVRAQLEQLAEYRQSALHWNRWMMENQFTLVYEAALNAYENISRQTGVRVRPQATQMEHLQAVRQDFQYFVKTSRNLSIRAAERESQTHHSLEYLADGQKARFDIRNMLGGDYHFTADEVFMENGRYVIQESKNAPRSLLPNMTDIQDGLFKLILFNNLSEMKRDSVSYPHSARLNLTGYGVRGHLHLPTTEAEIAFFVAQNKISPAKSAQIRQLEEEARHNRLEVYISGNGGKNEN